jgi:hypothetical protein
MGLYQVPISIAVSTVLYTDQNKYLYLIVVWVRMHEEERRERERKRGREGLDILKGQVRDSK